MDKLYSEGVLGVFITKISSRGMVMWRRKVGTLMEDLEAEGLAFRGSDKWRTLSTAHTSNLLSNHVKNK